MDDLDPLLPSHSSARARRPGTRRAPAQVCVILSLHCGHQERTSTSQDPSSRACRPGGVPRMTTEGMAGAVVPRHVVEDFSVNVLRAMFQNIAY